MLRKLITETVRRRLLEYASKNDEVSEASERLSYTIYRLYEYLLETREGILSA